jgi:hypothetical protein
MSSPNASMKSDRALHLAIAERVMNIAEIAVHSASLHAPYDLGTVAMVMNERSPI